MTLWSDEGSARSVEGSSQLGRVNSLSSILPADKLQLHSPSKEISIPVQHQSDESFCVLYL